LRIVYLKRLIMFDNILPELNVVGNKIPDNALIAICFKEVNTDT